MDPFENLLKAAQQLESPNVKVNIFLSTPPRASASSSMEPPPPPPAQVHLCQDPFLNNNVLAIPSFPSLPAPYASHFYAAAATAARIHLNPRYSGQDQIAVPVVASGHSNDQPAPLNMFPTIMQAQGIPQGLANPTPTAAYAPTQDAAIFGSTDTHTPGASNSIMAFVSPESNRDVSIHSHRVGAFVATTGSLELTPSAHPAELHKNKEDDHPASATDSKERNAVTPDAKCNNSGGIFAASDITLPYLFDEDDEPYINPGHNIIWTKILEPLIVPDYPEGTPAASASSGQAKGKKAKKHSRAGSIAFRCRYCKHSPNKKQLSTIYPETLEGLYRANLRFQSTHLGECEEVPHELKALIKKTKDKALRKAPGDVPAKKYWVSTAARKGYRNLELNRKEMISFVAP